MALRSIYNADHCFFLIILLYKSKIFFPKIITQGGPLKQGVLSRE